MWSHVKHKPEMQLEEFEGFFSFPLFFIFKQNLPEMSIRGKIKARRYALQNLGQYYLTPKKP